MRLVRGSFSALRRWCLITTAVLTLGASAGVASAFGATIADWEMNEPSGARTMHDSSGSGLSGAIGSAVLTGVVTNGATGYRWLGTNKDGYHPERLVTVNSSLLNPGTSDFVVTIRLFTGAGDQNIIQKGQATTTGGYWKIDMVEGRVICLFKGSEGRSAVRSTQKVWDNVWHTVRCERRGTRVSLTIDGGTPRTNVNPTGRIANNKVLAIGGKAACNGGSIQCDYYIGRLDFAVVEKP
jgi:Laminin G domain